MLAILLGLCSCGSGSDAPETVSNESDAADEVLDEGSEDLTDVESETTEDASGVTDEEKVELVVFAAASMTETMNEIAGIYMEKNPNVEVTYTFDSSGTLKTQIEENADCDIFISAAQKQMNELDITADAEINVDGLDFVDDTTRFDLVSNSVVLIVPEGNPAGIASFDDLTSDKIELMSIGNADVPVGQYSEEILTYLGFWDDLNDNSKITFGTNVKDVLSQVAEGVVDCGIVYSTDAATVDNVEIVASAPEGSHKPITYPAAILKGSQNPDAAKDFLDFLKTDECVKIFEDAGFLIP